MLLFKVCDTAMPFVTWSAASQVLPGTKFLMIGSAMPRARVVLQIANVKTIRNVAADAKDAPPRPPSAERKRIFWQVKSKKLRLRDPADY